jgi:hypothetical protein
LCRGALTSQTFAKLSLDHAESSFNVAALVVVGQEFGALEADKLSGFNEKGLRLLFCIA